MVDLVILRTEEVGLVSVDMIVFDVVTKVVVATSVADDVSFEVTIGRYSRRLRRVIVN